MLARLLSWWLLGLPPNNWPAYQRYLDLEIVLLFLFRTKLRQAFGMYIQRALNGCGCCEIEMDLQVSKNKRNNEKVKDAEDC